MITILSIFIIIFGFVFFICIHYLLKEIWAITWEIIKRVMNLISILISFNYILFYILEVNESYYST